jgi:hypothetical protein
MATREEVFAGDEVTNCTHRALNGAIRVKATQDSVERTR